jgi:hypothetical protein
VVNRFRSIRGGSPITSHTESRQLRSPYSVDRYLEDESSLVPLDFRTTDSGEFLIVLICCEMTNQTPKAGKLAKISYLLNSMDLPSNQTTNPATPNTSSAAHATTNAAEQHEGWEIVDPYSFYNQDLRVISRDVSAIDIRSDDTRASEPLDTRTIPIKPSNAD